MTSPRLSGDSVRSYLRDIGRIPLLQHDEEILLGRSVQRLMELKSMEEELELSDTKELSRVMDIPYKELRKQIRDGEKAKDKIDCYELSTPLTTKHFVNYEHGELYGLEHTPDRYKQKFLNPRTPIKGLFLTGQDIVTAGVGGALFSGFITTTAITGKNLWKKIYA